MLQPHRSGRLAVAAACLLACNAQVRGGDAAGSSGAAPNGPQPGDDGGASGQQFDVAGSAADGGDQGCQKVDFLFVVDNSGSMWDNQINLANSFPGFIAAITETLEAQDYHILVTDSDGWTPDSTMANADVACEVYPTCCFEMCGPGSTCSGFTGDTSFGPCPVPPPAPTACDATLGAGRNLDHNVFSPGPCPIADGRRFMLDDQADLLGTFECVARAGIGGDWNERPVGAAAAALSPEINGSGGCNEGFLRDDALLVVTIISDANPYSGHLDTEVPVQQFYDAIVAAKHGDPTAVVLLGLFDDGHVPGSPCGNPNGNEHYEDFVTQFGEQGNYGSVCAPDYAPFFLAAVEGIDFACENFVPVG